MVDAGKPKSANGRRRSCATAPSGAISPERTRSSNCLRLARPPTILLVRDRHRRIHPATVGGRHVGPADRLPRSARHLHRGSYEFTQPTSRERSSCRSARSPTFWSLARTRSRGLRRHRERHRRSVNVTLDMLAFETDSADSGEVVMPINLCLTAYRRADRRHQDRHVVRTPPQRRGSQRAPARRDDAGHQLHVRRPQVAELGDPQAATWVPPVS